MLLPLLLLPLLPLLLFLILKLLLLLLLLLPLLPLLLLLTPSSSGDVSFTGAAPHPPPPITIAYGKLSTSRPRTSLHPINEPDKSTPRELISDFKAFLNVNKSLTKTL
jgi:hypothetical protein